MYTSFSLLALMDALEKSAAPGDVEVIPPESSAGGNARVVRRARVLDAAPPAPPASTSTALAVRESPSLLPAVRETGLSTRVARPRSFPRFRNSGAQLQRLLGRSKWGGLAAGALAGLGGGALISALTGAGKKKQDFDVDTTY